MGYAAFAKHCSLFPMSLAVMAEFAKELQGYDLQGYDPFPVDGRCRQRGEENGEGADGGEPT